ncbi:MAG: ABC transporter ATP-binding protein [Chloroflexota bacterium]
MIEIDKLRAGYGKLEILHNVSLTLPADQFTTILGPNGSGKSTLLKSIFGITTIFEGSITYGGEELTGLSTAQIGRRGIAYVPQRDNIFPAMSVHDNLLLGARTMSRAEREEAMAGSYDLFPILQKRRGQRAGQLSGGERQMVAMALAWLRRPQVILLDEPTAGLAPLVATEVFRTLQTLRDRGVTLVVVEQNARRVLRFSEYVYVMREGTVAFQGTAAEVAADEDTVKGYLGVGIGKTFSGPGN